MDKKTQNIAIITGAGRGIGAATAVLLAQKGRTVALVARTEPELQSVRDRIQSQGGQAIVFCGDVSDEAFTQKVFSELSQAGRITALVNNAAVAIVRPFELLTSEDFDRTWKVNVRAPLLWSQKFFSYVRQEQSKSSPSPISDFAIVNVSSLGGIRATEKFVGMTAYSTSKFAVSGMTECLAVEGRPLGIRVNAIAPGAVSTQMLKQAAPHLKTNTTPEDVAQVIGALLDSGQSAALSGSIVEIFSNLSS
jgi:3-oxoacyl-[acyl-carrier protein] reductase